MNRVGHQTKPGHAVAVVCCYVGDPVAASMFHIFCGFGDVAQDRPLPTTSGECAMFSALAEVLAGLAACLISSPRQFWLRRILAAMPTLDFLFIIVSLCVAMCRTSILWRYRCQNATHLAICHDSSSSFCSCAAVVFLHHHRA